MEEKSLLNESRESPPDELDQPVLRKVQHQQMDIDLDSPGSQVDSGMSSLPDSIQTDKQAASEEETVDEEDSNISITSGDEDEVVISASIFPVSKLVPKEDDGRPRDASIVNGEKDMTVIEEVTNKWEELLPKTVTVLETDCGSKVYIVGTAHFSKESQDDVIKTIQLVRPDVVLLELCKARFSVLQMSEERILQEAEVMDFAKIMSVLREQGKMQGILYMLLMSSTAHITRELGMAPGGEFRTAYKEVASLPHCKVILGDRPIDITLSRALASLSLWKKIKLMVHILMSKEPISKEDVEKCKEKDFIAELLREMTGQFPEIHEVFVKERDIFLSRALQVAPRCGQVFPVNNYKKSPNPVVVGVVGIGHVSGIVANWKTVQVEDIGRIMKIPPTSRTTKYSVHAMYGEDCYSHMTHGLIYVDTSCPGSGIDESLFASVPQGCGCAECHEQCPCVRRSGAVRIHSGKLVMTRDSGSGPIYECNTDCGCDATCGNRLVQNGPLTGLTVEPIGGKGFGLSSRSAVTAGQFVCEYAGEIIGAAEADKRFGQQVAAHRNYILVMNEHFGGQRCVTVVDPTVIGNIGRYINHSCDPNLTVVPVRINSLVPQAAIFASRDIPAGEELCYSYASVAGFEHGSNSTLSTTVCLCSAKKCRGFLPSTAFCSL